MRASALSLHALTRRYPGAEYAAVDAVTLDVPAGELLALVGASGSGKTTTLRMIAGYELPDAGAVRLDGTDITRLPPERRGFGMVFQHYALFPHLSVEDNVAFGLEARGVRRAERRERARRALAGVGLDGKGARPVQALSGGEQQRVALARALVIEPRVLLLDEPLSNLDPSLRVTMRDELRALLHRQQVTAVFVTHDQEDAFAVADRVALLRHGRLLQVGTPEALYDRPAARAVAEFIGRAALVPATLAARLPDDPAPAGPTATWATIAIGRQARRVRATLPEHAAAATDLLAVLRPEALALAPADAPDAWPGTVTTRRFGGAAEVYHVALAGGPTVEVTSWERGVREGEPVGVRVVREPVPLVAARDPRTRMVPAVDAGEAALTPGLPAGAAGAAAAVAAGVAGAPGPLA